EEARDDLPLELVLGAVELVHLQVGEVVAADRLGHERGQLALGLAVDLAALAAVLLPALDLVVANARRLLEARLERRVLEQVPQLLWRGGEVVDDRQLHGASARAGRS